MSEPPRPLDYAKDVNADPSAARYLRWVVAGLSAVYVGRNTFNTIVWVLADYFTADTRRAWWHFVDMREVATLIACCAITIGAVHILRSRAYGARIVFWTFAVSAAWDLYIHIAQLIDVGSLQALDWVTVTNIRGALMMLSMSLMQHATVLLTTPPMARLMRLR